MKIPKMLNSKEIFSGNIVKVKQDTVLLDEKDEYSFDIIEHPGGVAIIPVLDNGNIVLIKQYRHPFRTHLIEVPAGRLNIGEDPIKAAIRELKEETGYIAGNIDLICCIYPSPAIFNEKIYLYKATDLTASYTEFDYGENIESLIVSLEEAHIMIKNGRIHDAKTIIAINSLLIKDIDE
ncbi:MAG: NUDIX hydrolase [bacterium]